MTTKIVTILEVMWYYSGLSVLNCESIVVVASSRHKGPWPLETTTTHNNEIDGPRGLGLRTMFNALGFVHESRDTTDHLASSACNRAGQVEPLAPPIRFHS